MNPDDREEVLLVLERVADLMGRWRVGSKDWCLLDGPAIKLHDATFDASAWRDHLNIYVQERALPWQTRAFELTVPPVGSAELRDLLELTRAGVQVHLVPASRYYKAGFEHAAVRLASGRFIEAATLRGCSQMWSYKSAEMVENLQLFKGDTERITCERVKRLRAAIAASSDATVRKKLLLLLKGYEALDRQKIEEAKKVFERAAGPRWRDSSESS